MGRPGCVARAHFVKINRKAYKAHFYAECKRCYRDRCRRAASRKLQNPQITYPFSPDGPHLIVGRQENFERHLRNHHNIYDFESAPVPPTPTLEKPFGSPSYQTPQPSHPSRVFENLPNQAAPAFVAPSTPAFAAPSTAAFAEIDPTGVYRRTYSPTQRREFERFLLEFQVALALPNSFVEHPATKRLFCFLDAVCLMYLPSRRVMGGRILNEYSAEYQEKKCLELQLKQNGTRGRVNLLSDVWQNIAKTHLLAVHLTLFGVVFVEGLHQVGSEYHGVALALQMETRIVSALAQGWNIGSVITDNAGQCERARRILAVRWPSIHFGKCFAHDINNLVKAMLLRTNFHTVTKQASAAVNALNASSSKWLKRANEVVEATYELPKALAFLSLCYTRWNSMQACFASLLRVKTALKQFAIRYQEDDELPSEVLVFTDGTFWDTLEDAERTIRPLCRTSFILQRDENTLADVVLCFRDILDGFIAGPHAQELIPLVEARWADCEQPLFILALVLHPRYLDVARALPKTGISSIGSVCNFAVLYFKRFFGRDPGMLRDQVDLWCNDALYVGPHDSLGWREFPSCARFWNYAKHKSPGPNLPDLALAVLSIAANTATCERYFSVLGRIHTPTRNCLKAAKTNKAAITSQAIRERDRQEAGASVSAEWSIDDDDEVVEEDSEGNKCTGRIIRPVEREFRGDNWANTSASTRAATGRATHASGRPSPTPTAAFPSASRNPATDAFSRPDVISSRAPPTPSRLHLISRNVPAALSHSGSRAGLPPRIRGSTSIHRRLLDFSSFETELDNRAAVPESESVVEEPQVEPSSEQDNNGQDNNQRDNQPAGAPTTRAHDLLSNWVAVFTQVPGPQPPPERADNDSDVTMEETTDCNAFRLRK